MPAGEGKSRSPDCSKIQKSEPFERRGSENMSCDKKPPKKKKKTIIEKIIHKQQKNLFTFVLVFS